MRRVIRLGLVVGMYLLAGCTLLLQPATTDSVHLRFGNPSGATASSTSPDNYLLDKPQYVLSYNRSQGIPNWVSWQLNQSWLGTVPRRNDFRPDESLPAGWYAVKPTDYNGSGFDRGHMTPSGDRTNSVTDNSATFLMTNILPQAPDNNQGPWADLENYCRDLVRQGKELYIIAGGYGQKPAIARGKVTPPAHTWKVIVVLDRPNQTPQEITEQTRIIAVDMPNSQGIREADWRQFRVSVDDIEAKTGYDFLTTVGTGVQATIERTVDRL